MSKPSYEFTKDKSELQLRFVFISKGNQDIIKVIDYDYVGLYNERKTFNLGFGDYNPSTGEIDDHVNTDNGDVYGVLNTVLNTVPLFFEEFPNHSLMVRGSDNGEEFLTKCISNCKKTCGNIFSCKNQNRRINLYIRYVNINHNDLIKEYQFIGGQEDTIEQFEKDKKYDTVFLLKNITLLYENKELKTR